MSWESITALAATEGSHGVTFLPFLQGGRGAGLTLRATQQRTKDRGLCGPEAPPPPSLPTRTLCAGERTPNWPHASSAVLGLRPGLLRPGLLLRVAMEGEAGWRGGLRI